MKVIPNTFRCHGGGGGSLSVLWIAKRWRRFRNSPQLVYSTSNRIRAQIPHSILRDTEGVKSHLAGVDVRLPLPFSYDVVVFQKVYPGLLGRLLRSLGVVVIWDVCDAVSCPTGLVDAVDVVTASSYELAESCRRLFPTTVEVEVVDDCQEANATWDYRRGSGAVCGTWYGTSASAQSCVPFLQDICRACPGIEFRFSTNDLPPWNRMPDFVGGINYHHDWRSTPPNSWQKFVADSTVGLVPVGAGIKSAHKVLNYMAYGIPVVCTPTQNHQRVVRHGVNGFLAASVEEWKSILRELLKEGTRAAVGMEARRTAARFGVREMGLRYLDVFRLHLARVRGSASPNGPCSVGERLR